MDKKFKNESLAKILLSSVNTLPSTKTGYFSSRSYLFRLISFNSKFEESWGVSEYSTVRIKTGEMLKTKEETIESIASYLDEIGGHNNIAFINSDNLSKAILVYTDDYLNKLVNKEAYLGQAILDYFNIWHVGKSGVKGPSGTRAHHESFKTFSKAEVNRLQEGYIPIAVSTSSLPAFAQTLDTILDVSALKEYMKVDIAANPLGVSVPGSRCWWIPKMVAKEYLQEDEPLKVLSRRVLHKVLYEAGLFEAPAAQDVQRITLSSLDTTKASNYVTSLSEEKIISEDFRERDVFSTRSRSVGTTGKTPINLNI